MPAPLFRRIDLDLLYLPFLERVLDMAADLRGRGLDFYAISGVRTFQEQARLYFQGRTTPGHIVTNAPPGFSAHNYGVAVDFCRDADLSREDLQPDWKLEDYAPLAEAAVKHSLEPGFNWKKFKEGPHVQLPLSAHGVEWADLKKAHDAGGLKAVWALLDTKGPW